MDSSLSSVGPESRAWIERDNATMSPSFTREYPLVVGHAEGSELWDVDGKRYVDFMAGIAVMNVGHRHPKVVEAVREQIDKFWHICLSDFYYPQAVELAEKIQAVAPMSGDTRLYLSNSGTEAVEAAVKLAMYHTKRPKFIGFMGAFHGRTLGSLSFTASKKTQRGRFSYGVPVNHVPYPDTYRPMLTSAPGENYGDTVINWMENELFRTLLDPHDVAGILIEPIQGEGGYLIPAHGFFPKLRQLADKYGILLITDEIQTGAGRTGKWWASEHEGVEPDIMCFAKGIGSGMPIGGIIASEDVMGWKPGAHGSTYGGNPVASIAALATMQVIEEEGILDQATETGQYMMDALAEMQGRYRSMGDVRGRGLMIGVEFVQDPETKERAIELRDEIIQKAFRKGLLLIPCGANTIRLTPPLNITRNLVDEGLKIFAEAVAETEKEFFN